MKSNVKCKMSNVQCKSAGFTLVELLIVIAITLIIGVASIPIYGNLQVSGQLNENSSQIIQTIRTAQSRSIARVNGAQHGIQFGNTNYTLYQGASYATRDTNLDRTVSLDTALAISTSLSGGSTDINFSKGFGVPSATGTVTLSHDVGGPRTITINDVGMVEED
jgi:prepilin-type N-terminal cleavage/methylation domain-containing protein